MKGDVTVITFLYGTYGSGKTTAVLEKIKKDTDMGIHTFLIVPEQEAVQSERATLLALPNSAQLKLEVLSFSRLYNRLCREYGGLSYRYITKPIRHLLMWQNMRELAPFLLEYNTFSERDSSICDIMLSAISECKSCGITPTELEAAAKRLPQDDRLSKRLTDLSLIYSSFDRLVAENYSDSSDDISRLYDILKKEDFFGGANVYIDSFTSFTAAEHRVIERIFAQADNVTVTVPMPSPECKDISVASIKRSHERLVRSASLHGGHKTHKLGGNRRAKYASLAHVAENLWRLDVSEGEGKVLNDGSITMEVCDTPYAEAEAVANRILELLRQGERCRDMLVLMRSPEKYRGIIEPAFAKNGIPFYFSEKTDLRSLPPVKLLFSALRIKQYNWQKNDIITHIKTGLYSFPLRSADLFEEYIETWNIHGARFTEGDGWTMNPDGYVSGEPSPRGKEILAAANEVRGQLLPTLEKFFILLDAAKNIPEMCRAVYTYFTDIELEDRLLTLATNEARRGNAKGASELRAIYGVILESLADIAAALPEEEATAEEFLLILRAVFDKTEVGTIPTSVDEVMIGSAATARASNQKYTFVMGLCEGEFPATVNDTGIFSSADRTALKDIDIELSSDSDTRSSDELMFAQKAFATASHGLYLFTSAAEFSGKARTPSMPWNRTLALLKEYKPHRFSGTDLSYSVGSARSAATHLRALEGKAEGEALKEAVSCSLPDAKRLCELPISADEALTVSPESVELAIGKSAQFSSSKFEKYVNCPLLFYCSSVLKLREKVNSDFLSSDMGTFVHAILEQIIRFATTENENGELPTDEEITEKTEKAVLEYIDLVSPSELRRSKRLSHIYDRLKRLALLMVRNIITEFRQSDFTPAYFELSIDGKNGAPKPWRIVLDDGSASEFIGKIDRVDVYRNENGVYIRVVDYKTGTKVFSLDDVEHGINTQMLLYLFMLCRDSGSEFLRALGVKEGEKPIPAGVMYLSADIPTLQATAHYDAETAERLAEEKLRRSGLVLNDAEILKAMNRNLSRRFLAGVYQKKDGEIVGDALTSSEDFEGLYAEINDTVKKMLTELRKGNAGASPLRYGDNDPCDFCKMKPVCRKE